MVYNLYSFHFYQFPSITKYSPGGQTIVVFGQIDSHLYSSPQQGVILKATFRSHGPHSISSQGGGIGWSSGQGYP